MQEVDWRRHETRGWRAVIGSIGPTFGAFAPGGHEEGAYPKGVVFHRVYFHGPLTWSVKGIKAVHAQIPEKAKEAAFPGVDMVYQGGLPIGIIDGIGTDKRIISAMEEATGIQGSTTITSVVEALRRLQLTKIIIVSGYFGEQVNAIFDRFMQDSGFEVIYHVERGQERHQEVPPHAYYRISKEAYHKFPQAQGILIAAGKTGGSQEVIEPLETDLGIPVVTQGSASRWHICNMVEVREPLEGWGRLLKL